MLLTAREKDCQFIWNAHAPGGRKAGLKDELIDNLRDKKDLPDLAPDEAAVIAYGREDQELFRTTVEEPLHERPAKHANSI